MCHAEKEAARTVPNSVGKPAPPQEKPLEREGARARGQVTHTALPRHPPSQAMSGASSAAPCSSCLGPSCLLKGLRWACRNRASFSSYSIAPHLRGGAGRGRDEHPAPRLPELHPLPAFLGSQRGCLASFSPQEGPGGASPPSQPPHASPHGWHPLSKSNDVQHGPTMQMGQARLEKDLTSARVARQMVWNPLLDPLATVQPRPRCPLGGKG